VNIFSKNILFVTPLVLSLTYCISCTHSSSSPEEVPFSRVEGTIDSSISSATILPVIEAIPDQYVNNLDLSVTPVVSNSEEDDAVVHWTKNYGPDDVQVHPETGQVTWRIDPNMPSESFHVGLKASAQSKNTSISFIVHVGLTQSEVITVGQNGDYPNLKAGMENLASGSTLVILDGTYTSEENYVGRADNGNLQHPPSGTPGAYTTIMAKHPGEAILTDSAYVSLQALAGHEPVSYVAFKGLFVKGGTLAAIGYGANKEESSLRHHHLKFIRNGVEADVATPFNAYRVDDILFENNYAFGGGRYKFASYQASNIVWRRNVARYDRGTEDDEPKGTYSVYSTLDAFLVNNLAVDADSYDFVERGELAGEFATPTTSGGTRAKFQRNIQLNSVFMFSNLSNLSEGSDAELSDMVSWDIRPVGGDYVKSFAPGWFDHITMGDIIPSEPMTFAFFNGWDYSCRGITNSILHNFQDGNMFYDLKKAPDFETVDGKMVERYGVDTNNITEFTGNLEAHDSVIENMTAIDPMQSDINPEGSLRYITRIERGTSLSVLAIDGTNLGATVVSFLGKSGTFFGEVGYDKETNIPMWPFPMEDIIKQKFSAYSYTGNTFSGKGDSRAATGSMGYINGERGFAVEGQTLTDYVWGYLGDVVPPFDVTASADQNSIVLQWQAGPAISQSKVTGYRVYDYDIESGEKILLEELSENQLVAKISGVKGNSRYALAVTSLEGNKESAIGYPVIVSTK